MKRIAVVYFIADLASIVMVRSSILSMVMKHAGFLIYMYKYMVVFFAVFFSFSTQIHIHDPRTPHYSQTRLKKSELKIIHDKVLLHITSLQGRMSILSIFFS